MIHGETPSTAIDAVSPTISALIVSFPCCIVPMWTCETCETSPFRPRSADLDVVAKVPDEPLLEVDIHHHRVGADKSFVGFVENPDRDGPFAVAHRPQVAGGSLDRRNDPVEPDDPVCGR